MSIFSKLMSAIGGGGERKRAVVPARAEEPAYAIPTVQFDPMRVTDRIKSDLRKNIKCIKDIDESHFDQVYETALRSINAGRDLGSLSKAILQMNINGMTKRRAGEISALLHNKATDLIEREDRLSLGIEYAIWMYSGAPCFKNPKKPSPRDVQRDAAHKAANGQRFSIKKGMLLNGRWTSPGQEEGCRCLSRSVIPGLD
jgi:hypothetical protein